MPPAVPSLTLNNGVEMPQLGFGVFQVPEEEVAAALAVAFDAGYRSIDTAALYQNERGVGKAIEASGLPREELFVTTKVWNTEQGYDSTLRAFDESMGRLGLDVLDLYLIHWPAPRQDRYVDTWRALQKLYADGRVRAIGVSNFQPAHLQRVVDESGVVPALNQVELHPFLQQQELRDFHARHGIRTEAWSPLGKGRDLLQHPVVTRVAAAQGVQPAQVVIRWHVQLGNVVIPKSVTPERIRANIDVFGFQLSSAEMQELAGLDEGRRLGPDPDTFG